jgi:hypothetical protein
MPDFRAYAHVVGTLARVSAHPGREPSERVAFAVF